MYDNSAAERPGVHILEDLGGAGVWGRRQAQAQPPAYQLLPGQEHLPRKPLSSLYLQGEGGVQAGGDGEDFCQVNDSTRVAQDLRRVGVGEMAVSRIRCFFVEMVWGEQ